MPAAGAVGGGLPFPTVVVRERRSPREAAALGEMLAAAEADGFNIRVRSAYRSYEEQEATFAFRVCLGKSRRGE